MAYQSVFKRYELKYIITDKQKTAVLNAMKPYMEMDKHGKSVIRNLYFDTDNYLLIRRSLEKPVYKEKLRLRCYEKATDKTVVFAELKKKYKRIVYKRRLALSEQAATDWLINDKKPKEQSQIFNEIEYFLSFYDKPSPKVFLSYEREAFYSKDRSDLRVTFDDNILSRTCNLSLKAEVGGEPLLEEGKILMEIKCSGGLPLWLVHILSQEKIYKTSFSKYGTAYQKYILPKLKEKTINATTI